MKQAINVTFISDDPDFNIANLSHVLNKSGIACEVYSAHAHGVSPVLRVSFKYDDDGAANPYCGYGRCNLDIPHDHPELSENKEPSVTTMEANPHCGFLRCSLNLEHSHGPRNERDEEAYATVAKKVD